jgi:hypothetical protein
MSKWWKKWYVRYVALSLLAVSITTVAGLLLSVRPVAADDVSCSGTIVSNPDGWTCTQSGGNPGGSDGSGGSGSNPGGGGTDHNNENNHSNNNSNTAGNGSECTPGTLVQGKVTIPLLSGGAPGGIVLPDKSVIDASGPIPGGLCTTATGMVDACTGEMAGVIGLNQDDSGNVSAFNCDTGSNHTSPNPCDKFILTSSGVTCTTDFEDGDSFPASQWQLTAHAPWPGAEIHTRPYPVTLVNWDTVMRVVGLGTSSGSGHIAYLPWGHGSNNAPSSGDWKNVTLRLEVRPVANWADVFLENIGLIRMRIGELHTFQWNLPSHPAAGGEPLSGQVGQLEELEPDVPLFTNWTRAPYMVYCTISYYEWEGACVNGPDDDGGTNCRKNAAGVFTGHREWGWKSHSQTVAVTPNMLKEPAPVSTLADLNNDGEPDAYWGRLSFIRRMDDAGRVDNPEWAHSYSWGPVWYWGVREGQGQIGWPNIPVE